MQAEPPLSSDRRPEQARSHRVFRGTSELRDNTGGLGNRRQHFFHSGNVILKVCKRLMDRFVDVYGLLATKRYYPAQFLFLELIHTFAQRQELVENLCDFGFAIGVHYFQPNLSMNASRDHAITMPGPWDLGAQAVE